MGGPKASAGGRIWKAFLSGALRPSLPGLLGTLFVFLGSIAVASAVATPERLAHFALPFTLRLGADVYGDATLGAFRARYSEVRPGAVGIFGASAQHNALGTSEQATRVFSEAAGRPTPVDVLCAPGISLPEMAAQIEYTMGSYPGAVVIGVTPMKIGQPGVLDRSQLCLGLVEPRLATGIWLVDQQAFSAPRIEAALVKWLQFHLPLVGRPQPASPPRRWPFGVEPYTEERYAAELPDRTERVDRNLARLESPGSGLAVLENLLSRLRERGTVVVLLESVLNPRLREAVDPELWERYRELMEQVAARHGAHYLDLAEAAGLTKDDFWDIGHVGLPAARGRYTRALAERVVPLIPEAAWARPKARTGGER